MQARLLAVTVGVLGLVSGPASADVVHDWNREALKVVFTVGPPQARALAIMHVG